MRSLKTLYKVNTNLRGLPKQGYCRPTVAEFFGPSDSYDYPWCSAEPVWTNDDKLITDNIGKTVTIPI